MANKQKYGISLIVLVITIIVMIILAASVVISLNNSGIINKAGQAVEDTNQAALANMEAMDYLEKTLIAMENPWNGVQSESFADGNGTENSPYKISNGGELAYFAKLVNEGNTFEGEYIEITDNINLNKRAFTPIGLGNTELIGESNWTTSEICFNGTLNGNGYMISNLNIRQEEIRGVGLIGILGEKGVVKNLEIFSGNIVGRAAVAGIAGFSKGTITTCINRATVIALDNIDASNSGQLAGGIVGSAFDCSITYCKNYGNITAKNDVALRSRGKCVGGIVGQLITTATSSEISNCYNYGNITSYYQQVGGIVGSTNTEESGTIDIINCQNTGRIYAKKPEKDFEEEVSIGFAGGIIGWAATGGSVITNCTNDGKIVSDDSTVGGIAGEISEGAKVEKCTNKGQVEGQSVVGGVVGASEASTVAHSTNIGKVTASNSLGGGIVGFAATTESVVRNCKNTGKISASNQQAGGIVGQTNGLIEKCVNYGYIYAANGAGGIASTTGNSGGSITGCENRGEVLGDNVAGGIVSLMVLTTSTVSDCKNYAAVTSGTQQAGGIVGNCPGEISDCYNEGYIKSNSTGGRGITGGIAGTLTGKITNSYNKGKIEAGAYEGRPDVVGGIVGLINGGTLSNAYSKGTLVGEAMGGIVGEISTSATSTITNTYYYATNGEKGVPETEDVSGQFEATTINLDTFEAFKNSSFYAK